MTTPVVMHWDGDARLPLATSNPDYYRYVKYKQEKPKATPVWDRYTVLFAYASVPLMSDREDEEIMHLDCKLWDYIPGAARRPPLLPEAS